MKILELWPSGTGDIGKTYAEMNDILNIIKNEIGVDLWTLDAIWHYFTNKALQNRIANGLQNEIDYSVPKEHRILHDTLNLVISGYKNVPEESIDERDLRTVLYILTDANHSKKIDIIDGSNLSAEIKNEIYQHLNRVHNGNESGKIGLLSEQDLKINISKDAQSDFANKIIKLCVKIIDMEDNDELFSIVEEDVTDNVHNIQAPIVSYILHFLKPSMFPILHGNNFSKLLKYLDLKVKDINSSDKYIDNSKIIREYRDNYCKFKNYWVLSDFSKKLDNPINLFLEKKAGIKMSENKQKNIILYGPPGTGKTYSTIDYALRIIDGNVPNDFSERMKRFNELKDEERVKFVTFHQSYGYEEFIEGIRPVMSNEDDENGEIRYSIQDGIFKEFCNTALSAKLSSPANENREETIDFNENFVFIIDEINRGNISRIFGELITLVEPSKRIGAEESLEVELPYSKEKFGVPDNVFIVATMNTADRSLVELDAALRRRFSFKEMKPKSDLVPIDVEGINLGRLLDTMNSRIEDLYDSDHAIGHSYFMNVRNLEELNEVFRNNIIPLLQEYFHDDYGKILYVLSRADDNNKSHFIYRTEATSINGYRATPKFKFMEELDKEAYISLYR